MNTVTNIYRLLVALALLAGCQAHPVAQPAATMQAVGVNTIATVYREGNPAPIAVNAVAPLTPESRGEALRRYCDMIAQPKDFVLLAFGTYELGKDAILALPDVTIRGMGMGQTILRGEVISDNVGTNFQLHNTTLEDLSLVNDCGAFDAQGNLLPHEDGRCVGFDNGTQFDRRPGPYKATLRRCRLWCRDWTFYNWSPGNTFTLEDHCIIVTGRVAVACENSGIGQDATIEDCKIVGDGSLSRSIGATSNLQTGVLAGVIARGGQIRVINCSMDLKGWPGIPGESATPRVCGITDMGGGGDVPAYETIEVYDLRCSITPNGSDPARCFDLDIAKDYVREKLRVNWANCWGSAKDGTLSRSW